MLNTYKTLLEKAINQQINGMKITISGKLQHVGFKTYIDNGAKKFNIRGKARNLSNGNIEGTFKGKYENLIDFLSYVKKGKPENKKGNKTKIINITVEYKYNKKLVRTIDSV